MLRRRRRAKRRRSSNGYAQQAVSKHEPEAFPRGSSRAGIPRIKSGGRLFETRFFEALLRMRARQGRLAR
jgi:hypothetical protein